MNERQTAHLKTTVRLGRGLRGRDIMLRLPIALDQQVRRLAVEQTRSVTNLVEVLVELGLRTLGNDKDRAA